MIRLKDFGYRYRQQPVFSQVNLEIAPGEITLVVGRNGSGKSTLASVLAGLKTNFQGEVWLDDLRLRRRTPVLSLRQKVGMVLQNPDHQILLSSVCDDIEFALQNLQIPAEDMSIRSKAERREAIRQARLEIIRTALQKVGLEDKLEANPRELSGGQKQRLAIAEALALEPAYLVLDEATSMLDLPARRTVYTTVQELRHQGIGVIMMTNQLDEILLADTVVILDAGKAHQYTPAELIRHQEILEKHGLEVPLLLRAARKLGAKSLQELEARL